MDSQQRKSLTRDEMARQLENDKPAHSSAMVVVLGLVSLMSLVIGFILGKIL